MSFSCYAIKVPVKKGERRPFKVRSKEDAKIFVNEAMGIGQCTYVVDKETAYVVSKTADGVAISMKKGDLNDVFNPLVEVANTRNTAYKDSVYDVIWKIRKTINEKWFNEE